MAKRRGGVVWSSDPEERERCPRCGQSPCACLPAPRRALAVQETARLGRSQKGRAGKTVVTIEGLDLDDASLRELARVVRQRCGTGGTVRDGAIEVQGDIRDRVAQVLQELGYRIKLVGG